MNNPKSDMRPDAILLIGVFLLGGCAQVARVQSVLGGGVPLYGNWCGPGHPSDSTNALPPIDFVDTACKNHDLCYEERGYFNCSCDLTFQEELQTGFADTGATTEDYPFLVEYASDSPDAVNSVRRYFKLPPCHDLAEAPTWTTAPKIQETHTGQIFHGIGRVSGLENPEKRKKNAVIAAFADLQDILDVFTAKLRRRIVGSLGEEKIKFRFYSLQKLDQTLTAAKQNTLREAEVDKYWEDPEGGDAFARASVGVNHLIRNIRFGRSGRPSTP